jgi:hypothetical protein
VADGAQPQIVKFFKMGDLSPKKKARDALPVKQAIASKDGLKKWSTNGQMLAQMVTSVISCAREWTNPAEERPS